MSLQSQGLSRRTKLTQETFSSQLPLCIKVSYFAWLLVYPAVPLKTTWTQKGVLRTRTWTTYSAHKQSFWSHTVPSALNWYRRLSSSDARTPGKYDLPFPLHSFINSDSLIDSNEPGAPRYLSVLSLTPSNLTLSTCSSLPLLLAVF